MPGQKKKKKKKTYQACSIMSIHFTGQYNLPRLQCKKNIH